MSTRSSSRPTARLASLAFALVALTGFAACVSAPTDPERDGSDPATIESLKPRLDGSDTTGGEWCEHTQPWDC